MHFRQLAFALFFMVTRVWAQQPPSIQQAWDAVIPDGVPSVAAAPMTVAPKADFEKHFFFESRTEYSGYSTGFTGLPTITGLIDAPVTGIFNPSGIAYPQAFQPAANQVFGTFDFGTRGFLWDSVNTNFGVRYQQDLTHVDPAAPASGILETFGGNRRLELTTANVEIKARPDTSIIAGRQSVAGAEFASLDGVSLTVDRGPFAVTLFGGRRFTYFSDPSQRAIGGANVLFRVGRATSVEYDGLWYIKGSNRVALRTRLGRSWLLSSYLRAYGGTPVDFSGQAYYTAPKGSLRIAFFEKLLDRDYFYDFTYDARDTGSNRLLRLYLGPLSQYSQFSVQAQRSLVKWVGLGVTIVLRRLNDSANQGSFDTSFQDYRAQASFSPWHKWSAFAEYHRHDSDRINPGNSTLFDDTSATGETSVKDVTVDLRRSFLEGRVGFNAGGYYRRISLQDKYYVIGGAHQNGFLAGAWARVDTHTRIFADYNLDNDYFLLRPSIQNSRILRLGMTWKY